MDEEARGDTVTTPMAAPSRWVRRLGAGEALFREGDVDRRVFVLLDGRVEVVKAGEKVAEVGVAESFIGEVSALTGKPRWATVRTLVPSTLLVIHDVEELVRADAAWALRLARVLAARLDRTNERLKRVEELLEAERQSSPTLVDNLKHAVEEVSREL